MRERPLKFNNEMLAKILSGEKTQTRRPVKGYDVFELVEDGFSAGHWRVHGPSLIDVPELDDDDNVISITPAGTYEKILVREKFIDHYCPYTIGGNYINACDINGNPVCEIFVKVSVERLQDGEGETDFESRYLAEGINRIHHGDGEYYYDSFRSEPHGENWCDPFDAWKELWISMYGEESWQANPWVWVIEFRRVA